MGHLVNPISFRLGVSKFSNFRWVAYHNKNYKYLVVKDISFVYFSNYFIHFFLRNIRVMRYFVDLKYLRYSNNKVKFFLYFYQEFDNFNIFKRSKFYSKIILKFYKIFFFLRLFEYFLDIILINFISNSYFSKKYLSCKLHILREIDLKIRSMYTLYFLILKKVLLNCQLFRNLVFFEVLKYLNWVYLFKKVFNYLNLRNNEKTSVYLFFFKYRLVSLYLDTSNIKRYIFKNFFTNYFKYKNIASKEMLYVVRQKFMGQLLIVTSLSKESLKKKFTFSNISKYFLFYNNLFYLQKILNLIKFYKIFFVYYNINSFFKKNILIKFFLKKELIYHNIFLNDTQINSFSGLNNKFKINYYTFLSMFFFGYGADDEHSLLIQEDPYSYYTCLGLTYKSHKYFICKRLYKLYKLISLDDFKFKKKYLAKRGPNLYITFLYKQWFLYKKKLWNSFLGYYSNSKLFFNNIDVIDEYYKLSKNIFDKSFFFYKYNLLSSYYKKYRIKKYSINSKKNNIFLYSNFSSKVYNIFTETSKKRSCLKIKRKNKKRKFFDFKDYYFFSNAIFVSRFIKQGISRELDIYEILRPLSKGLNKQVDDGLLGGYRIKVVGRFSKRKRSNVLLYNMGRISYSKMKLPLDFYQDFFFSRYGISGLKIWLYFPLVYKEYFFNKNLNRFYTLK